MAGEIKHMTRESLRNDWIALRIFCVQGPPPESDRDDVVHDRIEEFKITLDMADALGVETRNYRKALEKVERIYANVRERSDVRREDKYAIR